MDIVTWDSIASLLKQKEETVVSIYLPTHSLPTPQTMREDQTRFKTLIISIRERIAASGLSTDSARVFTQSLDYVRDSPEIWTQTTEGMAVFVSEQELKIYKLPMECEERITIDRFFDITPLLALLVYDQPYYVLALAVHQPRLFKGTMYSLEPVDVILPDSPEKALNIDELFSNSNTMRTSSTGRGTREKLSFHGLGDSRGAGSEERLKFFRMVDEMILDSKDFDPTLPLLIAGTSAEIAEYRDISKHDRILSSHIDGNQTKTQLSILHAATWPVIEWEVKRAKRHTLIERFNDLVGSKKASYDIDDIRDAAEIGRVDTLLVGNRKTTHDTINKTSPDSHTMYSKIMFPPTYDEQRVNDCAMTVVRHSGNVVGMDEAEMPGRSIMAALYRY
ncbi:hypothetical protein H7Y40_01880 [Pedobacter sp.]|nr:hypothetical protein [Candidatus Saccharibacteria bacterium]